MDLMSGVNRKVRLRAKVTDFSYPPVHDGLVIGRSAPIGLESFRNAIGLLVSVPFEHVPLEDDIVSDLLIRAAILKRLDRDKLVDFILRHVKPLMGGDEILHLDLSAEVEIEQESL